MAKPEKDPLERWRHHEAEYQEAVARYLDPSSEAPSLDKPTLLDLVQIRDKADRWREKYFRAGLDD